MRLTSAEIRSLFRLNRIDVFRNGLLIHRRARYPMARPESGKRTRIYGMSKQSKMRLAHIIWNCDAKFCSLLTLTYGDYIWPSDGAEAKRQLKTFLAAYRRRYSGEYCWFLEFTKKGRPHFHIISDVDPGPNDRVWLGETWSEISVLKSARRAVQGQKADGLNLPYPIAVGRLKTECQKSFEVHKHPRNWEAVRHSDGAMRYALKYAVKSEQKLVPLSFANCGRFWGLSKGVRAVPVARTWIDEEIGEDEAERILIEGAWGKRDLAPKYIFRRDALAFFEARGLPISEIFGPFYPIVRTDTDEMGV